MIPHDLNCPECGVEVYCYTRDALLKEIEKRCQQCGARFDVNEAVERG